VVNSDEVGMKFCKEGAAISIPININSNNLPIVHNSFVSINIKKKHPSKFRSVIHATGLYAALDYFANMSLGFFTTTIDWWENAVVAVDAEMEISPQTLRYFCAKWHYHTYNIR